MSHRYSDPSVGEKSFLLLEKNKYLDLKNNSTSHSSIQKKTVNTMDNASYVPDPNPSPVEARRIILSTESPAAQKLGTQQMIPKSLAIASKTKVPRHHSFAATTFSKELARNEPKRVSVPDICLDSPEDEPEGGGTLKRNLRNQSYRVAMKGFRDEDYEPRKPISSLKPVSEDPSAPPPRSPGRSKKTFAKKKFQRNTAGSFKDDPRLYQEYKERGLSSNNQESDDDLLDDGPVQAGPQPDDAIVVKSYRPAQLIWSQLPQVQEAGILDTISPEERKRQEAIFEIITSEYSYQHSLDILCRLFKKSEELKQTINSTDHHHLFSNIADILEVSKRFFEDLEKRHKDNPFIHDISDIVENHATNHFQPYVIYCSNEMYQQRTLQRLLTTNVTFKDTLKQIEVKPECGGLPMFSFLILPMQRVTRLPLLMDTICQKMESQSPEYEACTRALKAISKLVKQCNEGARKMERTEQMYTLQTQLEFGKIKPFPLISASRWLLKRGELTPVEEGGIFRKGFGKTSCYLFLFNDVLIMTKKKSEDSYTVTDYAKIDQYEVDMIDNGDNQVSASTKTGNIGNRSPTGPYLFQITMRKNSEGRQEQIVLAADTLSDRARWITALEVKEENKRYSRSKTAGLRQVEIIKAYMAKQADEVSLQQADVVLVLQEEDDWFHGERLRDGERGWFPQSCAKEITNQVAVERNVKRMERLRIETDV
ncbi:rho guanine nucleotide exchange factor 16 [Hyla sarda]|uniref:rho guanine nucleotide exchange factor 16 n=1 Tax=Hyla sarda TaxID=327740 RepID=UPI0024C273CF|nr:rho guanine nucleotide exchange factor 16 [Hyla sarda]XP_056400550.1 rho guanine nucleotide exchange factor 16 [Hyla sarda]XP_056400551.1 rho guanine nucleotide exchange factor 16 [Hyla sarda]XP_056400552.1 rho guanine nucleotide exchange factor 16 [Hyla sarda]XP_056400553.1 rho guanine nucleotide exchange factor 16 [Hyla sarda]